MAIIREKKMTAKIGDVIEFTRKGFTVSATVSNLRDKSVIVKIDNADTVRNLGLETEFTVVSHEKYRIVKRNTSPEHSVYVYSEWQSSFRKVN
ncbi:DUF2187 family protein (plasmid) [Metabacillus halosaccharovorans]|uniref:DUF2187 family protein n=1 Tax=Metabacillus halosaccharovorans TaxID=930124 RepID=UPI001C1F688C|nr:DUF2187 family protein [Metabacillus halosaccharovorans]MBU7595820.1 DUF2187 domain-containing protein [Metabacillus halosaccharovorans]MCM3441472.1 YkvS family protein [Metabacillus halosaccharovorans]